MRRQYSRLSQVEDRKNRRTIVVFGLATIFLLIFIINFGFPMMAKLSGFLTGNSETSFTEIDTTPPAPPNIDTLPEYINDGRLSVKGSSEPDSKVILILNNSEEELVTDIDGDFSTTFTLTKKENTLSAKTIDKSGNISQETKTYTIYYDLEAPEITITNPQNGDSFFGSDKKINIEGETEEGVSVTINGRVVIVGSDGRFTFPANLSEGENNFNIKARDRAENETEFDFKVNYSS